MGKVTRPSITTGGGPFGFEPSHSHSHSHSHSTLALLPNSSAVSEVSPSPFFLDHKQSSVSLLLLLFHHDFISDPNIQHPPSTIHHPPSTFNHPSCTVHLSAVGFASRWLLPPTPKPKPQTLGEQIMADDRIFPRASCAASPFDVLTGDCPYSSCSRQPVTHCMHRSVRDAIRDRGGRG